MKSETHEFSIQMLKSNWLKKNDKRCVFPKERTVALWGEAVDLFLSDGFSNLMNVVDSNMRRTILPVVQREMTSTNNLDAWHDFVSEWRERFRDPFRDKARSLADILGDAPELFSLCLADCIFSAALEVEFSQFSQSHYNRDWCDRLINGYLACYWDGDIEEGQFVLFDLVRAANLPMKPHATPKGEEPWDPDSPVKRETFWAQPKLENVKDRKIALAGFVHDMLALDWFRGVGKPLTNPPGDTRLFCNWDEAFMSFFDKAFTAARSDYAKRLEAAVMAVPALAKAWDELSSLWEQDYSATTRQKIRKSVPMASHTQEINAALHEPLKFGALEVAFADVAPNRFFRDWNYWIWRGYFPAEWFGGPPPESFARLLPPEVRNQEAPIEFGVL